MRYFLTFWWLIGRQWIACFFINLNVSNYLEVAKFLTYKEKPTCHWGWVYSLHKNIYQFSAPSSNLSLYIEGKDELEKMGLWIDKDDGKAAIDIKNVLLKHWHFFCCLGTFWSKYHSKKDWREVFLSAEEKTLYIYEKGFLFPLLLSFLFNWQHYVTYLNGLIWHDTRYVWTVTL